MAGFSEDQAGIIFHFLILAVEAQHKLRISRTIIEQTMHRGQQRPFPEGNQLVDHHALPLKRKNKSMRSFY